MKAKNTKINYADLFMFLVKKACTGVSYDKVTFDDIINGTYDFSMTTYIKARSKISQEMLEGINRQSIDYFYTLKEAIIKDMNDCNEFKNLIKDKEANENKERNKMNVKSTLSVIKVIKEREEDKTKIAEKQIEKNKNQGIREDITGQLRLLLNQMENKEQTNGSMLMEKGEAEKRMREILNEIEKSNTQEWITKNETVEIKQKRDNVKDLSDPEKSKTKEKDVIENHDNEQNFKNVPNIKDNSSNIDDPTKKRQPQK